jgi:hypothetical protein
MKNTSSGRFCWLVLPALWVCHTVAVAQQNVYGNGLIGSFQSQSNNFQSPFGNSITPAANQPLAPNMGTSALAGPSAFRSLYVPTGPGLVTVGPLAVYPHLLDTTTYGNGIEAQPGRNSTTWVNTVAPGLLLTLGSHWILDYTPSLAFYSNPLFHDTTGQHVVLNGVTTNGDWSLSLSQSYLDTTSPLLETGTQIEQQAYVTAFNAAWQMSSKLSLQLGLNQNFRFIPALDSVREWSSADWLNYQFEPQLGAALGVTGGYDLVSAGSDMPFEQALGRVVFAPGTKLLLILIGGAEDRQFVHPSETSLISPIFNASALYQIRDGTLLTVAASRSVVPSLYGNEINTITTFTGNLRQQIVGQMYLDLSGGYTSEPYTSIQPAPLPGGFTGPRPLSALAVTRTDTRTFEQIGLSTVFRTRLTATIFYMFSDNASSQSNFSYWGHQVGLTLSYRY